MDRSIWEEDNVTQGPVDRGYLWRDLGRGFRDLMKEKERKKWMRSVGDREKGMKKKRA